MEKLKAEEQHLAVRQDSGLLAVIEQIVATGITPDSVAAVGKLLEMQERVIADQRKQAFDTAMSRLQAKIPQIEKDGRVIVKGQERSRYAKFETIHDYLKPLLAEEGFSVSFDEESSTDAKVTFMMKVSHR